MATYGAITRETPSLYVLVCGVLYTYKKSGICIGMSQCMFQTYPSADAQEEEEYIWLMLHKQGINIARNIIFPFERSPRAHGGGLKQEFLKCCQDLHSRGLQRCKAIALPSIM